VSYQAEHGCDSAGGPETSVLRALPGLQGSWQVHAEIWGKHHCSWRSHQGW